MDLKTVLDVAHKHMVLEGFLASPLLARAINMIPMDGVFSIIRVFFSGIGKAGRTGVLAPIYQPLEDAFEKFLVGATKAACEGLDLDTRVVDVSMPKVEGYRDPNPPCQPPVDPKP